MKGTIAVVVGAKGGVGATTLCVELIRVLRETKACGLVDADFSGRRCVAVLTDSVRNFDGGRIGGNLASATILNDVAGIEFTASIDGAFTLMPDHVAGILNDVRDTTEFVLVDSPQPYAAAVRPFVVHAAHFIVVVEPTLLGVTSARAVRSIVATMCASLAAPEAMSSGLASPFGRRLLARRSPSGVFADGLSGSISSGTGSPSSAAASASTCFW